MTTDSSHNGEHAPRRELSLVVVQARPVPNDPVATQHAFESEVRRLRRMFPDADLFLYPELHLTGLAAFGTPIHDGQPSWADRAEPIPGRLTDRLCRLARDLAVWLVPGSLNERGDDGRLYNTAIAISPTGEIVARYRKIFPWRPWEDAATGDEIVTFDVPGKGRVGLMICYDGWFPEVARNLAWRGAEVILHPSATTTVDRPQELILARANAIVNQVFVVNVNAAGNPGLGLSVIADPEGRVLYEGGTGEEIIPITLNLDTVAAVRAHGSIGLGSKPGQQFAEEAMAVRWPMYHGGPRGEGNSGLEGSGPSVAGASMPGSAETAGRG
jgi:formamidase